MTRRGEGSRGTGQTFQSDALARRGGGGCQPHRSSAGFCPGPAAGWAALPTPTPTPGSWDLPSGAGGGVRRSTPPPCTHHGTRAGLLLTLRLRLTQAWTIFLEYTSAWLPLPSKTLPCCPEFSHSQVQLLGSALRVQGSVAAVCLCVLHAPRSGLAPAETRVTPTLPCRSPHLDALPTLRVRLAPARRPEAVCPPQKTASSALVSLGTCPRDIGVLAPKTPSSWALVPQYPTWGTGQSKRTERSQDRKET